MQTVSSSASPSVPPAASGMVAGVAPTPRLPVSSAYAGYQIIRRNGAVVAFEPNKIAVALADMV